MDIDVIHEFRCVSGRFTGEISHGLPIEVTSRINAERRSGHTFQSIANGLMSDKIPTARDKRKWYPATIRAIVQSDNAARQDKLSGADTVD
jgi:hypothetical protein